MRGKLEGEGRQYNTVTERRNGWRYRTRGRRQSKRRGKRGISSLPLFSDLAPSLRRPRFKSSVVPPGVPEGSSSLTLMISKPSSRETAIPGTAGDSSPYIVGSYSISSEALECHATEVGEDVGSGRCLDGGSENLGGEIGRIRSPSVGVDRCPIWSVQDNHRMKLA